MVYTMMKKLIPLLLLTATSFSSPGWFILRRLYSAGPKALVANFPQGISGVLYNPALCSGITEDELMISLERGCFDDSLLSIFLAHKFKDFVLSTGWIRYYVDAEIYWFRWEICGEAKLQHK